jgi:hypothetical protein
MKTITNQTQANLSANLLNLSTMKTKNIIIFMIVAIITLSGFNTYAHGGGTAHDGKHPDVILNVNPLLTTCEFGLSSKLTQSEFKTFNKQLGHIAYFSPLSSAKPLGRMKFDVDLQYKVTPVDQTLGAWNNTFEHVDSTHYLGDAVVIPFLHARIGVTDRIDVGIIFTHASPFGGHWGFLGGEAKYAFLNNVEHGWAASIRGSFTTLLGVESMKHTNGGIDLAVSKSFGPVTPYMGVAGTFNHSKETTDRVDLDNENGIDGRLIAGVEFKWKFVNIGAEYDVSELNTFSIKVGGTF